MERERRSGAERRQIQRRVGDRRSRRDRRGDGGVEDIGVERRAVPDRRQSSDRRGDSDRRSGEERRRSEEGPRDQT